MLSAVPRFNSSRLSSAPLPPCADVEYTLARSRYKFDEQEAYMATAFSVRDRLIEAWNDTNTYFK